MDQLLAQFKDEVCSRSKEIDPDEERDWCCLSIGFFLGKGASVEKAYELARLARYTHNYWLTPGFSG